MTREHLGTSLKAIAILCAVALVGCPRANLLGVSPKTLDFGESDSSLTFEVTLNEADVTWEATAADAPWITMDPASGAADGTVTVSIDRAQLEPGQFQERISVEGTSASGQTETEQVTVNVTIPAPQTAVSDSEIDFGAAGAGQTLEVFNESGGAFQWTAEVVGAPWLTLDQTSGTGAASVGLNVDRSELSLGDHSATITFTTLDDPDNAVTVTVTINIEPTFGTAYWPLAVGNEWTLGFASGPSAISVSKGISGDVLTIAVTDSRTVNGVEVWVLELTSPSLDYLFAGSGVGFAFAGQSITSSSPLLTATAFSAIGTASEVLGDAGSLGLSNIRSAIHERLPSLLKGPGPLPDFSECLEGVYPEEGMGEGQGEEPPAPEEPRLELFLAAVDGEWFFTFNPNRVELLPDTGGFLRWDQFAEVPAELEFFLLGGAGQKAGYDIEGINQAMVEALEPLGDALAEYFYPENSETNFENFLTLATDFGNEFQGYTSDSGVVEGTVDLLSAFGRGARPINDFIVGIVDLVVMLVEDLEPLGESLATYLGSEEAEDGVLTLLSDFGDDFSGFTSENILIQDSTRLLAALASGFADITTNTLNDPTHQDDEELLAFLDNISLYASIRGQEFTLDPVLFLDDLVEFIECHNVQSSPAMEVKRVLLDVVGALRTLVADAQAYEAPEDIDLQPFVDFTATIDTFFVVFSAIHPDDVLAEVIAVVTGKLNEFAVLLLGLEDLFNDVADAGEKLRDSLIGFSSADLSAPAYGEMFDAFATFFEDYGQANDSVIANVLGIASAAQGDIMGVLDDAGRQFEAAPQTFEEGSLSELVADSVDFLGVASDSESIDEIIALFGVGDVADAVALRVRVPLTRSIDFEDLIFRSVNHGLTIFESQWDGGTVETQGIPELYASGEYAYAIDETGGTVSFHNSVGNVRFFFVHPSGAAAAQATAFDENGNLAGTVTSGEAASFNESANFVTFAGRISRVDFSGGVVDDFSYVVVLEPVATEGEPADAKGPELFPESIDAPFAVMGKDIGPLWLFGLPLQRAVVNGVTTGKLAPVKRFGEPSIKTGCAANFMGDSRSSLPWGDMLVFILAIVACGLTGRSTISRDESLGGS